MLAKPRILVVDDDAMILKALDRTLSDDYDLILEERSKAALTCLSKEEIPIAIIDKNLSEGEDGLELAKVIKLQYPLTQTVLLTGEATMDTVISAINSGVVDSFINKPFEEKELREQIDKNLKLWSERSTLMEETVGKLLLGIPIDRANLESIGITKSILKIFMEKHLDMNRVILEFHMEVVGLSISNDASPLFRHFFKSSMYVINEEIFAGFIESLSRLNLDLFVESDSHPINELTVQDISLFIRPVGDLTFTFFIIGNPIDKAILNDILGQFANELFAMIGPKLSSELASENKKMIVDRLTQFRKSYLA